VYDLNDDDVVDQVQALPPDARAAFEELRSVIALVPWRSESASHAYPDGEVRFAPFSSTIGSGFVYFLILEDLNRVDLLELIWMG
jgi:hypothetical protein